MKRVLLLAIATAFGVAAIAQTIHPNSQDGVVWFKLKDDAVLEKRMVIKGSETTPLTPREELKCLAAFFEGNPNVKVTKPFDRFKAPALRRTYQLEFSDINNVDTYIKELEKFGQVEYAERVPFMRKTLVPNDPLYGPGNQWGLFKIQAETAWNYTTGNANIIVAVVDDAVDITHPDLSPVLWVNTGEIPGNGIDDDGNGYVDDRNGVNVATSTPSQEGSPMPGTPVTSFDHGTHVAGIACAASNNGTGIASIGHGVSLMGIRAASDNSSLTATLQGVLYAIDNGANVINMSFGSESYSTTYQNAITYGYNQGVVMIAACGNDNVNTVFYPAGYDHVIAVAATNGSDNKASFSNYDNGSGWVDVAAPGTSILSTLPTGSSSLYGNKQGTSMASPMVAGLAGLMLSMNSGLTPDDIESCLVSTCDPVAGSFSSSLGAGRVNASAAMACVSTSLDWAPEADFVANLTVIPQGGSVNFTDLSIYNPTSWTWTFTGGTPASSTAQNPQNITYNAPGTYPVTLQVSNANGTDTETKTGYIQVNASTGCDTISHTLPTDTIYTYSLSTNSYLGGTNSDGVTAYCDAYQSSEFPAGSSIQGMIIYFVRGATNNPAATVTVNVWSDAGGMPGAVVHSETVSLQEIEDNQTVPGQPGSFYPTMVEFDSPYLITGDFYVGISVPQPVPSGQEYVIAYTHDFNGDVTGRPNYSWMYIGTPNSFGAPAGWYDLETTFASTPRQAMHMHLLTTLHPVQATMQLSSTTVCAGNSISFSNSTNTNSVSNEWYANGTVNGYSNQTTADFIFNSPGSYMTYLVANNQCGFYDIDSTEVTVVATPSVSVTPQNEYICPGESITLTASGAAGYTWSPGATLSATTGASVTATPSTTTTYSIEATQGSCTASSQVTVYVESAPQAEIVFTPSTSVCYNEPVLFDGMINSSDVTSYSWTFESGTPSTSSNATETVTFPAAGTYTVTLVGANGCGQDETVTATVLVDNCDFLGLEEQGTRNLSGYYNSINTTLNLGFENMPEGEYDIQLFSMLGQRVMHQSVRVISPDQDEVVNVNEMAEGIYLVKITSGDAFEHTFRFKK